MRALCLYALEWAYAEYVSVADSPDMRRDSNKLRSKIAGDFYKELGVEDDEHDKAGALIALGRAAGEASAQIEKLGAYPEIQSVVSAQKGGDFKQYETWVRSWPALLMEFDARLLAFKQECIRLKAEVEKYRQESQARQQKVIELQQEGAKLKTLLGAKGAELEREVARREGLVRASLEGTVKTLQADLKDEKRRHSSTQAELAASQEKAARLEQLFRTTEAAKKQAEESQRKSLEDLKVFQARDAEVEELQKLSQHLRRWTQAYYSKQQEGDGELRPVGLVATLINFSLYQMCFSVVTRHAPLKKAMGQNLYRFSQLFSQTSNYQAACETLLKIEPEAAAEPEKSSGSNDGTIDHKLFQAILSRLKTDTGFNPGPFFIDERDSRITRVNAS